MNVFILLLAISKRLKLQEPDCIHSGDDMTKINFFFLKFLAFLEAEISLVEDVGILISKVVYSITRAVSSQHSSNTRACPSLP